MSLLFDQIDAAMQNQPRVLEWAALPLDERTIAKDFPYLKQWLDSEFHGEMSYMVNHLELREKPQLMEDWASSMVFFLWSYPAKLGAHHEGSPKISAYAQGRDYHEEIKGFVFELQENLRAQGLELKLRPFADSAPVFERNFAKELGLGWTGKNACLIHPRHGSACFIGGFFLDQVLERQLTQADYCGKCTRCIDACPTSALVAPGQVDARKCLSYITIEKRTPLSTQEGSWVQDWLFGCDVCQEVCPWNHKHLAFNPPAKQWDLEFWFSVLRRGGGFNSKLRGTPLMRGGRKQLLRNLCHWTLNQGHSQVELRALIECEEESDRGVYLKILDDYSKTSSVD